MASWVSTASSTASEIWSAILSGWPSVTDSDVNKNVRFLWLKPWLLVFCGLPFVLPGRTTARTHLRGGFAGSQVSKISRNEKLTHAPNPVKRRRAALPGVWFYSSSVSGARQQEGANEGVDIAVQHAVWIAHLELRPVVLHQLVRLQRVRANLASE